MKPALFQTRAKVWFFLVVLEGRKVCERESVCVMAANSTQTRSRRATQPHSRTVHARDAAERR